MSSLRWSEERLAAWEARTLGRAVGAPEPSPVPIQKPARALLGMIFMEMDADTLDEVPAVKNEPVIEVSLPWPPSTNRIWRSPRSGPLAGRVLLSADGRAYLSVASSVAAAANKCGQIQGRAGVVIKLFPPNRRRLDIDNRVKILLDALTKAGCWADDSQIDVLIIERGPIVASGRADVWVWEV